MKVVFGAVALAALVSPVAARADLNMQPGLWEAIMTRGNTQTPPDQKCYLPKDIVAVDQFQRGIKTPSQNPCRASDFQAIGNRVKYNMTCKINGQLNVSAVTMVYDGTKVTGEISGVDGTVTTVVNTRIGDCTQSSFPP